MDISRIIPWQFREFSDTRYRNWLMRVHDLHLRSVPTQKYIFKLFSLELWLYHHIDFSLLDIFLANKVPKSLFRQIQHVLSFPRCHRAPPSGHWP